MDREHSGAVEFRSPQREEEKFVEEERNAEFYVSQIKYLTDQMVEALRLGNGEVADGIEEQIRDYLEALKQANYMGLVTGEKNLVDDESRDEQHKSLMN